MARGWSQAEQDAYDNSAQGKADAAALAQRDAKRQQQLVDTGTDGNGYHLLAGTVSPDFGGSQYGVAGSTGAYDADVARDRSMADASNARVAPQLDQTQANQSRGLQMGALGLMSAAAQGNAPSQAAALGMSANDSAARAALAGSAGARGPGAAVAAMNGVQINAANVMGQRNAAITNMRANEMAANQGQYVSGAQQLQGQDIAAATTNAQLEAQQRALNEQRQQGFERRGWNVRNMESSAEDRYKRNTDQALATNEANDLARQDKSSQQDQQRGAMYMSAVSSAAGAAGSDERMKRNIKPMPMGSLSRFARSEK